MGNLFCSTVPPPPASQKEEAFMTCVLKVKVTKRGWERSVRKLLRNCEGVRFQMDQNGMVEVSASSNSEKMLKKIGKSSKIELRWIQFGQCSSNLVLQESKEISVKQQKPPQPQHMMNYYYPGPPHQIIPTPNSGGYPYAPYAHRYGSAPPRYPYPAQFIPYST